MKTLTFQDVHRLAQYGAKCQLQTDMFWGDKEITCYPQKMERTYFRLFKNLARVSSKKKPHKKDNGHTLTNDMVKDIVHHFQTLGIIPLGTIKVKP